MARNKLWYTYCVGSFASFVSGSLVVDVFTIVFAKLHKFKMLYHLFYMF
jgi:hypothetical protein